MRTRETGAYTLVSDAPEALGKVAEQFERDGYTKAHPWYEQEWDVMWSFGYPYQGERAVAPRLVRADQLINRYPALPFCSKSNLARLPFSFIPPAFDIPGQMHEFIDAYQKHPEKLWVRKNHGHRGVRLTSPHEVELLQRRSPSPIFVQEFVNPPHLISGRKWDIGVFVLLTLLKPLRLYAYQDIVLRFCPKDFPHQPAPADVGGYVVADDYTPYWDLEAFAPYREGQHSVADMLKSYFARQEPGLGWEERFRAQCLGAVYDIVRAHVQEMLDPCEEYPAGQRQFFELYRFDFVFDARLQAHLMEVNMSPNLSAVARPPLDDLFTRLVRDVFQLVGITGGAERRRKRQYPDFAAAWEMANCGNWRPLYLEFAGREPGLRKKLEQSRVDLPASQRRSLASGARVRFGLYGAVVECELPSFSDLEALANRLPDAASLDPGGPADLVYSIGADLNFFRDGQLRLRASSLDDALAALFWDLHYQIPRHARSALFVHAGAVVLNGRGVLLPGPRYSGKSMLVAALVEAGATCYSDEYATLDSSGHLFPYLSGDSPGRPSVSEAVPVGLIVSTRYDPSAIWAPRRLSSAQGLLAVLENTVRPREKAELAWTIQVLTRAARNSCAIASDRGEAGAAVNDIVAMHNSGALDA